MGIHLVDLSIFVVYLLGMLGVGMYYLKRNKSKEDYFVGGRTMSAGHVGLSVVATDVGGGFSIGLGGLGFSMGLSGSWMLFTGLLGAWLSAVILIPRVYPIAREFKFLTFPQSLGFHYGRKVALVAGIISLIGYVGFTSSQILAGAKLASATFPALSVKYATLVMGIIAVVYTVAGGIKAVIYTDTIQWIILMAGLIFIGIPMAYWHIGGWETIQETLPPHMLSLSSLPPIQFINWFITILPIWFVGMTLYQRIYACKDERTAKKAWYIAGLFEWPVMAFMGVVLGLFARVAFEQNMFASSGFNNSSAFDSELGLPLLLSTILPVGFMGIMMSAYFSAILSTADSCLMAASGNFVTDIVGFFRDKTRFHAIHFAQIITLLLGVVAIVLAASMQSVLDLMLYSYGFMVSGLFVPVIGSLLCKKPSPQAALAAMLSGGALTLLLAYLVETHGFTLPMDLDANFYGILVSALIFSIFQKLQQK